MTTATTPECFVQLSDPHIVIKGRLLMGQVDTAAFLARAVAHVCALPARPSHVLITGDLVERGGLDEYAHLRELLAPLPCPVLLMPGNHDDATAMRRAFPDHPELAPPDDPTLSSKVLWVREVAGLRVLALLPFQQWHWGLQEHHLLIGQRPGANH